MRSRTAPAHTPLVAAATGWRARIQAGRWESPTGFAVGVALLACALLSAASTAVALVTDQRSVVEHAALTVVWLLIGLFTANQCRVAARIPPSTAFVAVVTIWLTLIAASAITYEVLGTFTFWDDSLFESVAGFTTTASTTIDNPEILSRGALFWRAGTQWLGGLGAFLFIVAILPSIGVGGLAVTDPGSRHSSTSLRHPLVLRSLRRLTFLYCVLTGAGVILYVLGGMGPFDAVTYAATTISSGGFANHTGSFAHFDSVLVEWAGFGGMVLAGMNMAMLFGALRGHGLQSFLRSFELRAYGVIIVGGTAIITVANRGDSGLTHGAIRNAAFHVASAASTTGHHVGGWGAWDTGPQVILLAIMGVGAMSGSSGSGFRLVRALALFGVLKREMLRQLHSRAVAPARVGDRTVNDALASRMIGYQAAYMLVAATGAGAIALLGGELVTSISGAISALANFGPAMGELVPGAGGVSLMSRPARAALMPLMFLGRLEVAPVLVGMAIAVGSVTGRLDFIWGRFRSRDRR